MRIDVGFPTSTPSPRACSWVSPGEGLGVLGFSPGVATACRWTALGKADAQQLVLWGGSMPRTWTTV